MALPFLIGGLVAGLLAKAVYDDCNTSDSAENSRRRAERERALQEEQAKKEREKKLQFARDDFSTHGEAIGSDITKTLQYWIKVENKENPAFSVQLTQSGFSTKNPHTIIEGGKFVEALLQTGCLLEPPDTGTSNFLEETLSNIQKYVHFYAVELSIDTHLEQALEKIQQINTELNQIGSMQETIKQLELQILREEV